MFPWAAAEYNSRIESAVADSIRLLYLMFLMCATNRKSQPNSGWPPIPTDYTFSRQRKSVIAKKQVLQMGSVTLAARYHNTVYQNCEWMEASLS